MPRILIVEDDPHQREIYTRMLFFNGFDVVEAGTASRGVELARTRRPDAILMDVLLPDMDGLEATTLLKSEPETAQIPIICMTSYNVEEARVRAAGCHDLLKKPVGGPVLVKALRDQIGWADSSLLP